MGRSLPAGYTAESRGSPPGSVKGGAASAAARRGRRRRRKLVNKGPRTYVVHRRTEPDRYL